VGLFSAAWHDLVERPCTGCSHDKEKGNDCE